MTILKRTEDEVRDSAKILLGFDKIEKDIKQGTGQITTFNQLGFKGNNNKPDGWYLPTNKTIPAIILETKSEYEDISLQKWVDELIKNFPNNNTTPITTLMNSLYQLMGTTAENGTTANQFRSGMQSYVSGKGYSISYESCYQNSTMVNLTKIRQAVENNKVALIMCSTYNFVYDVYQNANGVAVNKIDSNRGHMMFVWGYVTYAFYKNGANIRNETFLYVSSGYQSGEEGFIMLNDHLTIEEAYVVTIS